MKKLLTALFLLYASINYAQFTLEHTYSTSVSEVQTGPSTWNYYTYNSWSLTIYDINHNGIQGITVPGIYGFTFSYLDYVSKGLFDNSGNWEYAVEYYKSTSPEEYLTIIWDQNENQLLRLDSCDGIQCFNAGSNGTKMIANRYGWVKGAYAGDVYGLGGTYYAPVKTISGDDKAASPYPNPSNDMIHLPYNLPEGANSAEMVITNIAGQVVKTSTVGSAFNDILLDSKQYAPGEYVYYIHTDNYTSPATKFIITR